MKRSLPALFSLLVFASACHKGNIELGEDTGWSEVLRLDAPSPSYGSDAGGVIVTLTGGEFVEGARVFFGDAEAQIQSFSPTELVVVAPPGEEGNVDVRVDSGESVVLAEGAFRYLRDGSGQAGALGAIEWYELLGGYWDAGSVSWGSAWWGLIQPKDIRYADVFGGEADACVSGPGFPDVRLMELGANQTTLSGADGALSFTLANDGFFEASPEASSLSTQGGWRLEPVTNGPFLGMTVEDLARTPAAVTLTSPKLDDDEAITLGVDELKLKWEGGEGDELLVMVRRSDADYNELETVGCVVTNDGGFTVPESAWQAPWGDGEWLFIYIGAMAEGEAVLPHNNSESRVVGLRWVVGAALTPEG